MPHTTLVAGTTITASWANANVRDQVITPFASASARDSAITAPIEGQYAHLNDTNKLTHYNGSVWVPAVSCIVARQSLTTNSSTFSGDATTDQVLGSVPVDVSRLYVVRHRTAWSVDGGAVWDINLWVDGVQTDRMGVVNTAGAGSGEYESGVLWEPTTGTKSLDIRVDELSGVANLTLVGTAVAKRYFWVEDIGPR